MLTNYYIYFNLQLSRVVNNIIKIDIMIIQKSFTPLFP
jgi:hypothetical protein